MSKGRIYFRPELLFFWGGGKDGMGAEIKESVKIYGNETCPWLCRKLRRVEMVVAFFRPSEQLNTGIVFFAIARS